MERNMVEEHLRAERFYTKHAHERAQQRSIPPFVVDLLLSFGRAQRSHKADLYTFDKRCRRELRRYLGAEHYQRIADQLDCWAVIADDGSVVSIGHRLRRFKH
jgi:hypothetical protein